MFTDWSLLRLLFSVIQPVLLFAGSGQWLEHELIFLVRCACRINRKAWVLPPEEAPLSLRHFCLGPEDGVFPPPVLSKLRICGSFTILSFPFFFFWPWKARTVSLRGGHIVWGHLTLISHTEVLISKQTACRCTLGQCFFWLPWLKWNGQAVVRLASEWAKGSWEIGVRLWMQVTANG